MAGASGAREQDGACDLEVGVWLGQQAFRVVQEGERGVVVTAVRGEFDACDVNLNFLGGVVLGLVEEFLGDVEAPELHGDHGAHGEDVGLAGEGDERVLCLLEGGVILVLQAEVVDPAQEGGEGVGEGSAGGGERVRVLGVPEDPRHRARFVEQAGGAQGNSLQSGEQRERLRPLLGGREAGPGEPAAGE